MHTTVAGAIYRGLAYPLEWRHWGNQRRRLRASPHTRYLTRANHSKSVELAQQEQAVLGVVHAKYAAIKTPYGRRQRGQAKQVLWARPRRARRRRRARRQFERCLYHVTLDWTRNLVVSWRHADVHMRHFPVDELNPKRVTWGSTERQMSRSHHHKWGGKEDSEVSPEDYA